MPTTANLQPVLSFLDDLSQNNNKPWFDEHRPAYAAARNAFEQFIDGVIDAFREVDNLQGLAARDCFPRINRDVRFSKDKSPYKTNLGALVAPGGWRATAQGYYISLQPHGQSMVAGGLYDPDAAAIGSISPGRRPGRGRVQAYRAGPGICRCFRGCRRRSPQDRAQGL